MKIKDVFVSQHPGGGADGAAEAIRCANVDDAKVENVTVDRGFFGVLSIGGQLVDSGNVSTKFQVSNSTFKDSQSLISNPPMPKE